MNSIDDLSNDAEASDIISQLEENSADVAASQVNDKGDKSVVGGEWSDPWSSGPWKNGAWANPSNNNQSRVESSFESLQFTPVIKTAGENSELFDFADAFGAPFGPSGSPATTNGAIKHSFATTSNRGSNTKSSPAIVTESKINVGVVVKERLSIFFDETTNDPSCKVVGSIYVKPTKRRISSFSLTIRDSRNHIEHWDERNRRCRNITAAVPHLALDSGDQVYSISLNREHQQDLGLDSPVVRYTCFPTLRPMPMVSVTQVRIQQKLVLSPISNINLVYYAIDSVFSHFENCMIFITVYYEQLLKTKSHQRSDRCRLGVRIRANPQNNYTLKDFVVLIIVPLGLNGENVTMSLRGGVWNDMKRSLVWNIPKLDPGEVIDIQAQFKTRTEEGPRESCLESHKFVVLARCIGDTNFTKIDLNTDYTEDGSCPVGMNLERSATVLYRKI